MLGSGQVVPATVAAESARPPNIVFILADDVGYECLGCYGGTSYSTPHLDALARSGMRFNFCFSTPECCPSRAEMMTGRYPFRTGMTENRELGNFLDPFKEITVAKFLQSDGYATALSGKWHLGDWDKHPELAWLQGFDSYSFWVHGGERYWSPDIFENGNPHSGLKGRFGPDVFNEFAIDFMTRNRDHPFFLYVPMVLVHEKLEDPPGSFGSGKPGSNTHGHFSASRFATNVTYMDKLVGDLVSAIDRLGLRENTVIVYSGDNGTATVHASKLGDAKIEGGKATMTDRGSRVPLIVSWKGRTPASTVSDDLVDFSDFFPTFLELAGHPMTPHMKSDGHSFALTIQGQPCQPRDWVFVELGAQYYVRDRNWKLMNDGKLFDMTKAPFAEKWVADPGQFPQALTERSRLQSVLDHLHQAPGLLPATAAPKS